MVLLAYSLHFWGILWYFSIQKLPEKWGNGFSGSFLVCNKFIGLTVFRLPESEIRHGAATNRDYSDWQ